MEHTVKHSILLSILICTMPRRKVLFDRIVAEINSQIAQCGAHGKIEVLHLSDDGEMTVGEKRNRLIRKAFGEYIAFVDDDDMVSGDYIKSILDALSTKPDCVGIEGILQMDDKKYLFKHSITYAGWYTGGDGVFYRTPNHLNPIKKTIAERMGFPNIRHGEDHQYSMRIRPFLASEVMIEHPIYFYLK